MKTYYLVNDSKNTWNVKNVFRAASTEEAEELVKETYPDVLIGTLDGYKQTSYTIGEDVCILADFLPLNESYNPDWKPIQKLYTFAELDHCSWIEPEAVEIAENAFMDPDMCEEWYNAQMEGHGLKISTACNDVYSEDMVIDEIACTIPELIKYCKDNFGIDYTMYIGHPSYTGEICLNRNDTIEEFTDYLHSDLCDYEAAGVFSALMLAYTEEAKRLNEIGYYYSYREQVTRENLYHSDELFDSEGNIVSF